MECCKKVSNDNCTCGQIVYKRSKVLCVKEIEVLTPAFRIVPKVEVKKWCEVVPCEKVVRWNEIRPRTELRKSYILQRI